MFNNEFFPTPLDVISQMMEGEQIEGKVFLEPNAGKGDIIDYLQDNNAKDILICENDRELQKICKTKATFVESDFFELQSERISHIDCIVMNPPFSNADKHILHAYAIAPAGCRIIALCNLDTVRNPYSQTRQQLSKLIDEYGNYIDIGDAFKLAERKTFVNVALVKITKAGENYKSEFEGFFMDEEPEVNSGEGIMQYDAVRDIVNRYVNAVKLFDNQLKDGVKMYDLVKMFSGGGDSFVLADQEKASKRNAFKKDLQRDAWKFIFNKLNLTKYTTRGVREDINKFIEQQKEIPFTMKNIYRMLEIVIGTAAQRMDKAILEVFDRVTEHHHENRHNPKGWKTNSHYVVGKKFILPNMVSPAKEYSYTSETYSHLKNSSDGIIPDFEKALCYITGDRYEEIEYIDGKQVHKGIKTLNHSINRNTYGEWYECEYFKYKGYKNGNMHFEFKDEDVWAMFNQRISKIKGYPLYEAKEQTAYQKRQSGKSDPEKKANPVRNVLFSINI